MWISALTAVVLTCLLVFVSARVSERLRGPVCIHSANIRATSPSVNGQLYSELSSWAADSIRIRISPDRIVDVDYQALLTPPPALTTDCAVDAAANALVNGN